MDVIEIRKRNREILEEKMPELVDSSFDLDEIIKKIHLIVTEDYPEEWEELKDIDWRGNYRYVAKSAEDFDESAYKIYPSSKDIPELMKEYEIKLEQLLDAVEPNNIHKTLRVAAWAFLNLGVVHPFEDGNGRVARGLVDYIFRKKAGRRIEFPLFLESLDGDSKISEIAQNHGERILENTLRDNEFDIAKYFEAVKQKIISEIKNTNAKNIDDLKEVDMLGIFYLGRYTFLLTDERECAEENISRRVAQINKLREFIGAKVEFEEVIFGEYKKNEDILEYIDNYDRIKLGIFDSPFVGMGDAIISISHEGNILYENLLIKKNHKLHLSEIRALNDLKLKSFGQEAELVDLEGYEKEMDELCTPKNKLNNFELDKRYEEGFFSKRQYALLRNIPERGNTDRDLLTENMKQAKELFVLLEPYESSECKNIIYQFFDAVRKSNKEINENIYHPVALELRDLFIKLRPHYIGAQFTLFELALIANEKKKLDIPIEEAPYRTKYGIRMVNLEIMEETEDRIRHFYLGSKNDT